MPPKTPPGLRLDPGLERAPGPLSAPTARDRWASLRAISLRCVMTQPRAFCPWHAHPFDELCLATDDACLTGKAGRVLATEAGTLLHYPAGEEHAFWNDERQRPRFWVVHFTADAELTSALTLLRARPAGRRLWRLTRPQVETFKWLFMRLSAEHSQAEPGAALAESAWLRLLLVHVQRWVSGASAPPPTPSAVRPDLLALWQMIQDCAGRPGEFRERIRTFANYNSLRQEFTAAFGCSPSQLALRTRIQIAKNLLIETPLSIKQIAEELGYVRQHEFTRAFRRTTGRSPTRWRADPHPVTAGG
jgi:quercetin dioxygenase-like cupin family protein